MTQDLTDDSPAPPEPSPADETAEETAPPPPMKTIDDVLAVLPPELQPLTTQLADLQQTAAEAQRQATFYQYAPGNNIRRDSVRLAYLAAVDGGFLTDDGAIDWKGLKTTSCPV